MFAEIESLRSRISNKDIEIESMRKSQLASIMKR